MKTFKLNGKTIKTKPFDFNMVCDLEDLGVKLEDFGDKPMGIARAYLSICSGMSKDEVGVEMQAHIVNGGTFDELYSIMSDEIENSDFFRALNKTEETETPKTQTKRTTTKKTTV